MMAADPETYEPYYYDDDDFERNAAIAVGMLDTSVSNPSWFRPSADSHDAVAPSAEASDAEPAPPNRSHFPRGEAGREEFRTKRDEWLSELGIEVSGSSEQHRAFHSNTRNYRARNT